MIAARAGEVLHQLTEDTAMQLCAAFAGRTDEADGEAPVVGHRHERRFAVARQAFDADLFCVHCLVGFEIIERAARAPSPRTQRAPILRLARLSFVAEADDAFGQSSAIVSLNAGRDENRVTPAFGENLLLPGRPAAGGTTAEAAETATTGRVCSAWATACDHIRPACSIRAATKTTQAAEAAEAKFHHHRHGYGGIGRRGQCQLNVHADQRIGGVVNVTNELLCDDGKIAIGCLRSAHHFPLHCGHVLGHAAINFPIEILDDFRSPLLPPHFGAGHALAVFQHERVWEVRIRISLRLVEVDRIGRVRVVGIRAGAQGLDSEKLHHQAMVLLRGELHGRRELVGVGPRCRGLLRKTAVQGGKNRERHEAGAKVRAGVGVNAVLRSTGFSPLHRWSEKGCCQAT